MTHIFDDGIESISKSGMHPGSDEYDALADLFLGESPSLRLTDDAREADEPHEHDAPAPAASAARLEALVLGHLPVLAGAWAAQHARSLAEETGRPVALMRLTTGSASVDLFGPRHAIGDLRRCDALESAIEAASRLGVIWTLRVDAPFELELASAPDVRRVCLLSGVDDAAVVAAYRTLKGLHEALPEDVESGRRKITLRLMGTAEPETYEAQAKISRVSRAFLSCDVGFLPATTRIDAGAGRTLFRGDCEEDLHQAIEAIQRFAPVEEVEPETAPPTTPSPAGAETRAPDREPERLTPGFLTSTPPEPDAIAPRIGLRPLEVRCPAAPHVELALDDAARLHLLGLGASAAEELLAAEGWARLNLGLIGAAAGYEPLGDVVVRVLTDQPARDRRLLDGRFRVDLLREVHVNEHSAWCCVPLNAEDETPLAQK